MFWHDRDGITSKHTRKCKKTRGKTHEKWAYMWISFRSGATSIREPIAENFLNYFLSVDGRKLYSKIQGIYIALNQSTHWQELETPHN